MNSSHLPAAASHVDEQEGQAQGDAYRTHHYVGDAQEGILPAQHRGGGENHPFGAVKRDHRII